MHDITPANAQLSSSKKSTFSSNKKTRSRANPPTGKFEIPSRSNLPVWVNIYVGDERKWVEGVIDKINNSAAQIGQYNVVVIIFQTGCNWEVTP